MPLSEVKIVVQDELHQKLVDFINEKEVIIGTYQDMIDMILTMIRGGYCFNVDRERLRDAMEDITFMCCPEDDVNKDRVTQGLEYESEDNEDEDDDDDIEDIPRDDLEEIN